MRSSTSFLSCFIFTKSALSEMACGVCSGYDRGVNAYFYSGDGSLANFSSCSAKCQSDTRCQSFAFGDSQCLLYSQPLKENFREQSGSPFLFYDRNCVDVEPTSSFTTVLPPPSHSSSGSSTTGLPDTTNPISASATNEESGSNGTSEGGIASSVQSAVSTSMEATTAVSVGGQFGASKTASSTMTIATSGASISQESSDIPSSRTAKSTSTSSSSKYSQSSDSKSIASVLLHYDWWLALLGYFCLTAVFV